MASNEKDEILVVGHKNPDTDSICSAIALAELKNRIDPNRHYMARRAGQINGETRYVLEKFNFEIPPYVVDVGTQVKDMAIRRSPKVGRDCTLKKAWAIMKENSLVTLPIRNEDNSLDGLISVGDIARTYMESAVDTHMLSEAKVRFGAIAETIKGTIAVGSGEDCMTEGKVLIGAADTSAFKDLVEKGDLVILATNLQHPLAAIESGASCIILTFGVELLPEVREAAEKAGCAIITTELDTYSVSRQLIQSIPLSFIMKTKNLVTFSTEEYTDNIRDIMVKNKHRAFPVINKNGKCLGTISRRNFLGMSKKKVILVDHNDLDQAVDNMQSAEVLEIYDHHKLGDVQTSQPILVRNEPVGCTATILYRMYQEERIDPSPEIAGILCAAIISDTLMFRSPTCTILDKMAAGGLSLIAGIDIEKFATEMFRAGSELKNKSPEEIFYQDFKKFNTESITFGIGQISSMAPDELASLKDRMLAFMRNECGLNGVSQVYFMLTSIIDERTELLYCGDGSRDTVEKAFQVPVSEESCLLPGVVSRKKQLVPSLLLAMQAESVE